MAQLCVAIVPIARLEPFLRQIEAIRGGSRVEPAGIDRARILVHGYTPSLPNIERGATVSGNPSRYV